MNNKKTDNTTEAQKISVGKMDFMIIDESPNDIPEDAKQLIETQLFNVFKKYENNNKG